jgi:hypothetical protein
VKIANIYQPVESRIESVGNTADRKERVCHSSSPSWTSHGNAPAPDESSLLSPNFCGADPWSAADALVGFFSFARL